MKLFARILLLMSMTSVAFIPVAVAQNTPGTSVTVASVSTDIQTLFQLAEQAYPSLFSNSTGWRSHNGFTYQYYAAGGIYAGVKNGNVYLLGGAFGTSIVEKGILGTAIAALQNAIAKQTANAGSNTSGGTGSSPATADFASLASFATIVDLVDTFKVIAIEYSTTVGSISSTSVVKLEYLETGMANGVVADHLLVTLSGGSLGSTTVPYTMWVDKTGKIQRLIHDLSGVEYSPQTTAQAIGSGLISGFLLALKTANSATLQAALTEQLKSPALSSKISTKTIGKQDAQVITLTVTGIPGEKIEWDVADFGSFTMVTHYSSDGILGKSYTDVIELQLK